jgi:hypothetical protein
MSDYAGGDRYVCLDDLDLTPLQRRRAEELLTVRRGLAGEAVVDADALEEMWPWIVHDEPDLDEPDFDEERSP